MPAALVFVCCVQEVFSAVRDEYMRDGEGFLLVFSLTHKGSFLAIQEFYDKIRQAKDTDEELPVVLAGNKVSKPFVIGFFVWKCSFICTLHDGAHQTDFQSLQYIDELFFQ